MRKQIANRDLIRRSGLLYRRQRYHIRAKFLGVLWWVCGCCGQINWTRMMQRRYLVICTECRAKYIPKVNLALLPAGGRRTIPPDYIIPNEKGAGAIRESFPMGDMDYWKQGECVHEMTVVRMTDEDGEVEEVEEVSKYGDPGDSATGTE